MEGYSWVSLRWRGHCENVPLVGHFAFSVRKQRGMRAGAWFTFPFSYGLRNQLLRGAVHLWGGQSFPSFKPLWNHPQSPLEVCLLGDSKPSQIDRRTIPIVEGLWVGMYSHRSRGAQGNTFFREGRDSCVMAFSWLTLPDWCHKRVCMVDSRNGT